MSPRGSGLPIAFLVLVLGMLGCRTPPAPLGSVSGTPLAIDDARADHVLTRYLESVAGRSGLRGSARVALEGPDFKLNRPQRIVVERPDRLRFEVLGLFDQLAAVLVTDGRRYGFFDASTGQVARGYVTPSLLWDLAKLDLDPEEAVGLLLGAPAPSPGIARTSVWLEPTGRIALAFAWPRIDLEGDCAGDPERRLLDSRCFAPPAALREGGEIFFFDEEGRLDEIRSLGEEGVVRYRALFEDYRALNEDGALFPNRVTIRSPEMSAEARFEWKRVMLGGRASEGGPLPDRLFSIPERAAR